MYEAIQFDPTLQENMIQAQGAKAKKSGGGQKPKDMFNKGTEVK